MNNKTISIVIGIIILITIIVIISIILLNKSSLSPSASGNSILETCNTLKSSRDSTGAVNLVFFSAKEQAQEYTDFFLQTPPFNQEQNQKAFNFYYIDNYQPECELYKGIAILCYSKELIKKASSCPNDYIIVLRQENPGIRSSAYMNVMSINTALTKSVLTHEFGHVFANLAEEYTPASIPRGSQNCQASCDNFNIKDSCSQGCSKTDYYRSIDSGIMRTLSVNVYGKFNEKLIIEKLSKQNKVITGKVIENTNTECQSQQYYLIEGNYLTNNNQISITDKTIENGCLGNNGAGPFTYNIILKDNSIIPGDEFNPELIFTDGQPLDDVQTEINGETFISDQPFLLKLPIIQNSKIIEINKDAEKIAEISLDDIGARPCLI